MSDQLTALTYELLDKQAERPQALAVVDHHKNYLTTGNAIGLNNLGDANQYKDATDKLRAIDSDIETLIEKVVAAYPESIIWVSKELEQPIFLKRTQSGFHALIPPSPKSLSDKFALGFIKN